MKRFVVRRYCLSAPVSLRIALLSDLHAQNIPHLAQSLREAAPDVICMSGDMMENHRNADKTPAFQLMEACAAIARTYYALGNHDRSIPRQDRRKVAESGVTLLDNACDRYAGVWFGGMTSQSGEGFLRRFSARTGYKILLCHHPEYYEPLLKDMPLQLILAGHTHGGQWRLGRQGVYAPGQGLFPKYSGGLYDGRLLICRGLANTAPAPRLGNPREWDLIELKAQPQ